ncbi:helix-turn-helix domain-containing protein [Virgibacillus sp. FSP13]
MSEFSKNLKRLRVSKKLTLQELADDINKKLGTKISKGMISKWENGKEATNASASALATYFGVDLDEILGLNISDEDVHIPNDLIPIVGTIAAGTPIFAEQNILGYAPGPPMMKLIDRSVFYLKIKGESMNREFENGSFVLIDRDIQVENGEIAAVMVNGDEATVKKVYCKDNILTLIPMSNDETFFPETINLEKEEATIIGKVIGAFKQY